MGTSCLDKRWLLFFFALALFYKIYACFQVPVVTSDVLRQLGYASHAIDNNFGIYTTTALDFKPEVWTRYWSNQTYIYPPVTLLFFYLFSIFHLGIFWVKITLTIVDLFCTYLFYKYVSKLAAVLFFCAPVMLWYSSHEGQFEVIQSLFIILNALAIKNRQWRLSGFYFAISIQVKQLGLLIAPWMLYEMWREKSVSGKSFYSILIQVAQGAVLGFIPFLMFYVRTPFLLLLPVTQGSNLIYNPFYWIFVMGRFFSWNPKWLIYWNAVFTYTPLIILLVAIFRSNKKEKFISAIPLVSFWFLIKSLKWGQFWYTIINPGFIFCLSRKKLIHLLLCLHLLQCLHSTVSIIYKPIGSVESQESRNIMKSCMFTCNPQQLIPTTQPVQGKAAASE